jgi:starch phosphorylase
VSSARDPVCGMPVDERTELVADVEGVRFRFCSEFCRQQFLRHPAAYNGGASATRPIARWFERRVAYFTMEIALENGIPTYSGGLGVLAGDTLRSCADLDVPVVAVSLVHRRGYVHQELRDGHQTDQEAPWRPEDRLAVLEPRVSVEIEGRPVAVRAWRYDIAGSRGYVVPVLLLDTDVAENAADDRRITDRLYGGDDRYRLAQEIVLGIGGVRVLEALGCSGLQTFHLNEGHAALAPLELLRSRAGTAQGWDFQAIRNRTVFTTHTPVASGHDRFDWRLARHVLGEAAGCDLWLNTPQRPLEASGTSGMKAAHNGVPSMSVLDGWWREGHIEGVTGWSIGGETGDDASDALDLYRKLEELIVPMFYEHRPAWIGVMKQAIGINASFFNTHRMVRQYVDHAYSADAGVARAG